MAPKDDLVRRRTSLHLPRCISLLAARVAIQLVGVSSCSSCRDSGHGTPLEVRWCSAERRERWSHRLIMVHLHSLNLFETLVVKLFNPCILSGSRPTEPVKARSRRVSENMLCISNCCSTYDLSGKALSLLATTRNCSISVIIDSINRYYPISIPIFKQSIYRFPLSRYRIDIGRYKSKISVFCHPYLSSDTKYRAAEVATLIGVQVFDPISV
jgi:hypothetical protein